MPKKEEPLFKAKYMPSEELTAECDKLLILLGNMTADLIATKQGNKAAARRFRQASRHFWRESKKMRDLSIHEETEAAIEAHKKQSGEAS